MQTDASVAAACPRCGTTDVVHGSLIASDEDASFTGHFFPDGLRFLAVRRSVPVDAGRQFRACTMCGCIWSHLDAQALRVLMQQRRVGPTPFADGVTWTGKIVLMGALLALIGVVIASALEVLP